MPPITSGLCHADLAQFGWLERRIRRAEIHRRVFDLRDARSRADRLIVHPDALARAVLGRPFRQDRKHEGRTRTGDFDRIQRTGQSQSLSRASRPTHALSHFQSSKYVIFNMSGHIDVCHMFVIRE
jgi:hypothetical protein